MKVFEIRRGDTLHTGALSQVVMGPARVYPGAAVLDGMRHDVYGVECAPARFRRGKLDWEQMEKSGALSYSIQCADTLGTDNVSPLQVVEREGVQIWPM